MKLTTEQIAEIQARHDYLEQIGVANTEHVIMLTKDRAAILSHLAPISEEDLQAEIDEILRPLADDGITKKNAYFVFTGISGVLREFAIRHGIVEVKP